MRVTTILRDFEKTAQTVAFAFFLCVYAIWPAAASAQTDVWKGGAGNWSDASKWSAGVPTLTSNVFIDNGNGQASVVTVNGGYQCNTLTIDADDTLIIPGGSALAVYGTSIVNAGKIVLDDTNGYAALGVATGQNATLTGGGTVTMNDAMKDWGAFINGVPNSTLTNVNNNIQGSGQIGQVGGLLLVNQAGGVINANQAGYELAITATGGATNQGLMEATSGGMLFFSQNLPVNNSGGTISVIGAASTALLLSITQGGTLTTSGGGVIQGEGTLDGATHGMLNNQGTFTVPGGHSTVLMGTINNTGTFVLDDTNGDSSLGIAGNVTLTGGGSVAMNDTTGAVAAFISGAPGTILTNVNNKIQGSGQIGQAGGLALVNQKKGIINANQAHALYVNAPGGTTNQGLIEATAGSTLFITTSVSNTGIFTVAKSSLLQVTNTFSNFSGTTLTGGTYNVTGTLQFPGANIATNAAHISLIGATSAILDLSNNNGLRSLASTTSKGGLALRSGRTLTTPGSYSNAGTLTVGGGTKFTVTGSYTQTAGTTTVDGTLTAPSGTTIQAGRVFGKGTIASTAVSSGSVTAGDSLTKSGKLAPATYTQNANGSLNVQIGGTTVGTQYSQLAVANGASLNGTLNIKLINSFLPAIGNSFTILTGSTVAGTFATVNGLSVNSGEHFQIAYNGTNVTLTVVSGP